MRTLVTGAGGFAGLHIVRRLLADGHTVFALVRRPHDGLAALAGADTRLTVLEGGLAALRDCGIDVDGIVHAAAATPGPDLKLDSAIDDTVLGTRLLLEYAQRARPHWVVLLSSLSVYGRVTVDRLTVDTPSVDPNFYGLTKRLSEMILLDGLSDAAVAVLRLPGLVGDHGATTRVGEHSVLLGRLRETLLRNEPVRLTNAGRPFNTVLHAADLAGFVAAAPGLEAGTASFGLPAATDPAPLAEIVGLMRDLVGSSSEIVDLGERPPHYTVDVGWRLPGVTFEAMSVLDTARRFCAPVS